MKTGKGKHVLSIERQRLEREKIGFQVQLTGKLFLTWNSILGMVNLERRYRITFHGCPEVHQGGRLLELLLDRMRELILTAMFRRNLRAITAGTPSPAPANQRRT